LNGVHRSEQCRRSRGEQRGGGRGERAARRRCLIRHHFGIRSAISDGEGRVLEEGRVAPGVALINDENSNIYERELRKA